LEGDVLSGLFRINQTSSGKGVVSMWNRRNENELTPRNAQPEPLMSPKPAIVPGKRDSENPAPPQTAAMIGVSMTIKGEISSREELYIDGEIDGKLELQHRLTVGPSGKVRAAVKAKEVIIFGTIQGNVQAAEKIVIRKSGSLIGDIRTAGIIIDDGAYFKGSIDIIVKKPEVASVSKGMAATASMAS
jgi:cytoskeletal protein CcmA (bactofilin family)